METTLAMTVVGGAMLASIAVAAALDWLCLRGIMRLMPLRATAPARAEMREASRRPNVADGRRIRFIPTATHREKTEAKPASNVKGGALVRTSPAELHRNSINIHRIKRLRNACRARRLGAIGPRGPDSELKARREP